MIPDFVIKSKDAAREYKMTLLQFGHAADGNVHQEILKSGLEEKDWRERYPLLKQKIFQLSSKMGGYITAEHGIGLTKKDDMYRTLSKKEIDLMSRIKSIFDPNNILTPGKVIDIDTI